MQGIEHIEEIFHTPPSLSIISAYEPNINQRNDFQITGEKQHRTAQCHSFGSGGKIPSI
jgi:hypothetical protein